MMNRLALLCVVMLLIPLPAQAESGVIETRSWAYAQAIQWTDEGRYELAAKLFDDLDGYEDSDKYALYVQALTAVNADDLLTAKIILETLLSRDFAQGDALLSYIEAQEMEAAGDLSAALSAFDQLAVLDSAERAAALRETLRNMPAVPEIEDIYGDADGIHLQWAASEGADSYAIYRSLFSGYGFIQIDETASLSYADTEMLPDKTYYYRIVGMNTSYTSEPSTTRGGAKVASVKVAAPQTIAIASSEDEASLSWSPVHGATAYTVYRAYAELGDFALVTTTSLPSFRDADAGKAAYYKICAQNDNGESLPSETAKHVDQAQPNIPLTAVHLEATDASTVRLSWDGSSDGAYLLSYQAEGASRATYLAITGNTKTLDNLAPNTLYSFTIEDVLHQITLRKDILTAPSEWFTTHSFKFQRCGVYWVQDGDDDFYARRRTRVETTTQQQLLSDMESGSFAVILEFTWQLTAAEKEWYELWVMRTPSGDVYTYAQPNQCDGEWESVSASLPLEPLFEQYKKDAATWEQGAYVFEVYFDGLLAGETSFMME